VLLGGKKQKEGEEEERGTERGKGGS